MPLIARLLSIFAAFSLLTVAKEGCAAEPALKFGVGLENGRIASDLPLAALDKQKLSQCCRPDEMAPVYPWQQAESARFLVWS